MFVSNKTCVLFYWTCQLSESIKVFTFLCCYWKCFKLWGIRVLTPYLSTRRLCTIIGLKHELLTLNSSYLPNIEANTLILSWLKSRSRPVLTIYLPPIHTQVVGMSASFWRIALLVELFAEVWNAWKFTFFTFSPALLTDIDFWFNDF